MRTIVLDIKQKLLILVPFIVLIGCFLGIKQQLDSQHTSLTLGIEQLTSSTNDACAKDKMLLDIIDYQDQCIMLNSQWRWIIDGENLVTIGFCQYFMKQKKITQYEETL